MQVALLGTIEGNLIEYRIDLNFHLDCRLLLTADRSALPP